MEEKINIRPIEIAITAGISTFIGFSLIIPLMIFTNKPSEWGLAFLFIFYFLISGIGFFGLIFSLLLGLISYLIVKIFVKNQVSKKYFNLLKYAIVFLSLLIGFLAFQPVKQFTMELSFGKGRIEISNVDKDGKPHKWFHYDVYGTTSEIDYDTNLDGKPDVWEYYDGDGEVYKKVIDTDYDGKSDVKEFYKKGELVKREIISKTIKK